MKKILAALLLLTIALNISFAQAPQKMGYQAIVRDISNNLVVNQNISVRISILQGSPTGASLYTESHLATTNANGLVTLVIGDGNVLYNNLAQINWGSDNYYLQAEIDPTGGNNYSITSVQQLLSVPYALYAEHAANVPTFSIMPTDTGYVVTLIPDTGNMQTYVVRNGLPGAPGPQGPAGQDGFSPDVFITALDSLRTRVTITSAQHPNGQSFIISNGSSISTDTSGCSNISLCDIYNMVSGMQTTISTLQQNVNALQDSLTSLTNSFNHQQSIIDSLQHIIGPTNTDGQVCPGTPTIVDIDGNSYATVMIGTQCWMKENLRTTRYYDGTIIPLDTAISDSTAYRYYPNGDSTNVANFGYLYNWSAVMHNSVSSNSTPSGVQGICPQGWHIPSEPEWMDLEDYVSSQTNYSCDGTPYNIAKALATTSGWNTSLFTCAVGYNQEQNNATGFSAKPAGGYNYNGYICHGSVACFWSSTIAQDDIVHARYLDSNLLYVGRNTNNGYNGYSVRCLRNQ